MTILRRTLAALLAGAGIGPALAQHLYENRPDLPTVTATDVQAVVDAFFKVAGPPARDAFVQAQQDCMTKAQKTAKPPVAFQTPAPGSNPITAAMMQAMNGALATGAAVYSPGSSPETRQCFQKAQDQLMADQKRQEGMPGFHDAEKAQRVLHKLAECQEGKPTVAEGCVSQAVIPNRGVVYSPTVGTREVNVRPDAAWLARAASDMNAERSRNAAFQAATLPNVEIKR